MKGAAIAGGIVCGLMLALVGFLMIGPGGSNSYATPARLGGLSMIGLPLGYLAIASSRDLRSVFGPIALAIMALLLFVAWAPLMSDDWMLEIQGMLGLWSLLWLGAASPFAVAIVRK